MTQHSTALTSRPHIHHHAAVHCRQEHSRTASEPVTKVVIRATNEARLPHLRVVCQIAVGFCTLKELHKQKHHLLPFI
jgi:hypothetical protein